MSTGIFFCLLYTSYCLSINKTFKDFAKSKIHRLLIPYAVTAVIWGCLQTLKSFIKNGALDGVKQAIKCIYAILYGGGQGQGSFYLTKSLEWKAIGCEVGMLWFLLAPVSYTHLDVYKRQVNMFGMMYTVCNGHPLV